MEVGESQRLPSGIPGSLPELQWRKIHARGVPSRWSMSLATMPNRNLSTDELKRANELLADIRTRLPNLAAGDPLLLFAYRRKVVKELGYDERGKPGTRGKLKALKWGQQNGKCAQCGKELELKYSELDRKNAADGYTIESTELVHAKCHQERQAAKGYT